MEIECVLLLSDHYKCVVPFYKSALSRPKWSAKSALSLASHKRKGAVKLYSAQEKLRSAVLSEVLNGTDHLRGVGVLVVVPGHDLNLIGVVQNIPLSYQNRFVRTTIISRFSVICKDSIRFASDLHFSDFSVYFYDNPRFKRLGSRASAGAALPSTLLRSAMTARLATCS